MDKSDNTQAPVGESTATGASSTSANAGTSSTALGTPGFLQSVQQRLDSMGEDGSFLAARYD